MRSATPQKTKPTIRFGAKLARTSLALPKNANAELPSGGVVMAEGMINHIPFRAVLKPDGKGNHCVETNRAMQDAIGASAGDDVMVEITRLGEEPEIRVPIDLDRALKATAQARGSWMDITPMARRDWIFSICSAKQPETRKRRIEKARDMLASGKRRLCCFPGIKQLMKENARSCGMWLPLTSPKKHISLAKKNMFS